MEWHHGCFVEYRWIVRSAPGSASFVQLDEGLTGHKWGSDAGPDRFIYRSYPPTQKWSWHTKMMCRLQFFWHEFYLNWEGSVGNDEIGQYFLDGSQAFFHQEHGVILQIYHSGLLRNIS